MIFSNILYHSKKGTPRMNQGDKPTPTTGVRESIAEQATPDMSLDSLRAEMRAKVKASQAVSQQPTPQITKKQDIDLSSSISNPKFKAVRYGIIGTGHGGSRLAEQFYQFGYKVCVTNTSEQDLYHIQLPEDNKLFMDFALGGAGKDMDVGAAATLESEEKIKQMVDKIFGQEAKDIDAFVLSVGGGGGCIAEDANIFTTFCGLENIKTLYSRIKNRTDSVPEPTESGELIDVRKLNIKTFSLNKKGSFEEDQILEISKHFVPKERVYTVETSDGTQVTTSDTHPFFVLNDGLVESIPSSKLIPGSLIFKPKITWPFLENKISVGLELNSNICWLIGLILGDGSFIKTKNMQSLRIYTDSEATAKKAIEIMNKTFNETCSYKWKPKNNYFEVICNYRSTVEKLLLLCECKYGAKGAIIDIPELITKSSRDSVLAFIAGFIDADGWITERNINLGSISKKFISKMTSLLQLLGYSATFLIEKNKSKTRDTTSWKPFYKAKVSTNLAQLSRELSPYVTNEKRLDRLLNFKEIYSRQSVSVNRDFILNSLCKIGLNFNIKNRKIENVSLHDLVNNRSNKLTLEKISRLKDLVITKGERNSYYDKLMSFLEICPSTKEVVAVFNSEKECEFYDFSVAKNNNYLAGEGGLTVVHNTGTGSAIPLISILSDYGLPITVLYTLPMVNEGTITKANAIEGLNKLSQLVVNKLLNGLVIIDNSRIEDMYSDVSLGGFFKVANFDIANIFNTFNTLSSLPTQYTAIDPMDFTKIMTSGGCTIYGKIEIPLHIEDGQVVMDEDDIAELLLENMQNSMLAEGFNVSEALRFGVYITGKAEYLDQIPASTFNYAFASLNDELKKADLFRGVYVDQRLESSLVVYLLVSGVGLPRERVQQLIEQAQSDVEEMEEKEHNVRAKMEVFQQTNSNKEQDRYRQKKKENSTFGKMVSRRRDRS